MANKIRDMTGARVGMLTVVGIMPDRDKHGRAEWLCRCDCGKEVVRKSSRLGKALKEGQSSHCGCSPALLDHGLTKGNKRMHWVWASMLQRCNNPSNKDYPHYGGRGIEVCAAWRSFKAFYEWASSSGYRDGVTIERIDVNDGYHPGNCTWIENERQSLNTTRTTYLTHDGRTMCLSDWAAEKGMGYKTLRNRIFLYGWTVERAITQPVGTKG